ncbi:hypothetical protein NC653_030449 [Populus alba x Populus x berolinensis]|uniref:Uncharacterized GPI-anchored protein At5g19230-like domain-containing protein n=1 Tax=Populus alba x Populus x berolinensis TaxID=444605 RepID=A0AAD6Q240_9ROSI|nr:hypothetical protein NC653_030449 [Populus alba x Populus x berolinensis]
MAVVATPQMLPFCLFAYPENDEQTLVNFQNYSRSQYERYVNESSYGGAGVGANENWMVVVFVENTTSWTSAGGAKRKFGFRGRFWPLPGVFVARDIALLSSFIASF